MPANYLPTPPESGHRPPPEHQWSTIFVSMASDQRDPADTATGPYWAMASKVAEHLLAATPIDGRMESRILNNLTAVSCSVGYSFALRRDLDVLPLAFLGESVASTQSPAEVVHSSIHDRRLVSVSTAIGPERFVTVEGDFED